MPQYHYVPILRWKAGEEGALFHLLATQKTDVFPLIILMNEQYKDRKATKKKPAITAAVDFINRILTCWGTQPFYLDASNIPTPPNAPHPLVAIAAVAQSKGAIMIPATNLGATTGYTQAVIHVFQSQQAGVALRVDLNEATTAHIWVSQWPVPIKETDLIIDLEDTAPTVARLGAVAQSAFVNLHLGALWRTVTVCGTSMPGNFSGLAQGLHTIPRSEYLLWLNLHTATPYKLHYGDYTTPPISEPPTGIAYGFPINVRYTLIDDFLICKGVRTKGFGSIAQGVQLTGHANSIKTFPSRGYLHGCWADNEIDLIAGGKSPQTLGYWVTIGVNRHISLTRHIIP